MEKKSAQIILIDKNTGKKIEEVDVNTRSDLVRYSDKETLSDKLNRIDNEINSLKNPYKSPVVSVDNYEVFHEIGTGNYSVTFNISKGTINVSDIMISDNGIERYLGESEIEKLNLSGSLSVNCTVDPITNKYHNIMITVMDELDNLAVEDAKVLFVYPSYWFDIPIEEKQIDIEHRLSGKMVGIGDSITLTSGKFINNRRSIFMSPDEVTKITDQNGFDVTNIFCHKIHIIDCIDGTSQPYHVYISNGYNGAIHKFTFSFKGE